jgi:hypothetical protein
MKLNDIKVGEVYGVDFQVPSGMRWTEYERTPVLVLQKHSTKDLIKILTDNGLAYIAKAKDLYEWKKEIPETLKNNPAYKM